MDPLSVTASLIAVIQLAGSVISAVYNYRKDTGNAPQSAAKIVQNLNGLAQVLEQLLLLVEEEKRHAGSTRLISLEKLLEPNGSLQTCQQTLQSLNEKLQPEPGWRAVRQSLIWPLKQDQVKKSLDEIANVKSTLALALATDQTTIAIDTKDSVDALTKSLASLRTDKEKKSILEQFSRTDPTTNHLAAQRKRQHGTSGWLLSSNEYMEWIDAHASVLYINGIPGCGKTIICSAVIDDLQERCQRQHKHTAVAYYYFNFQSKEEQQFPNMMRSLIVQLCNQTIEVPQIFRGWKIWNLRADFSDETLIDIAQDLFEVFETVNIVLDAIDECEQVETVVQWIASLAANSDNHVRILVSSRQSHDLNEAFDVEGVRKLALDANTFTKDIETHIRQRITADPRMSKWAASVQNNVERSLVVNSGGLFRWVDCQLDILRKCLRVNNVQAILDTPPKTLNETYDRIIAGIDEAYTDDALRILRWLLVSPRPLKATELNEILGFDCSDPGDPVFSADLRLTVTEDVLTLCSSLITISLPSEETKAEAELLQVSLAHRSVKDYLQSKHIQTGPHSLFALDVQLSHSVVASCCLTYLRQVVSVAKLKVLHSLPLAAYAAQFWTFHYSNAKTTNCEILDKLALQFFNTKNAYENCMNVYDPDTPWGHSQRDRGDPIPRLYYVSLAGLVRLIGPLIAQGDHPNGETVRATYREPLGAAGYKGHTACIEALLAAGADPDGCEYGGEYGLPLATAASGGQNEVIKILLRAGADVNKRDDFGSGPPVYQAAASRYPDTVQLLLDAGANPLGSAGMSGVITAPEVAAKNGDLRSLNLLFAKADDIRAAHILRLVATDRNRKAFDSLLETPRGRKLGLQYAPLGGWDDLVQEMIAQNSGMVPKGSLAKAAASGSVEALQVIYEKQMQDSPYSAEDLSDAMFHAVLNNKHLAVQCLINRGADVTSEKAGKDLHLAVERNFITIVQALLSGGVSANSSSKERWDDRPCLMAAIVHRRLEIARLLVDHGADVNVRDRRETGLQRAIQSDSEDMFHLLRSHGASTEPVPVENPSYDCAALCVHLAARWGHVGIFRKLAEDGLDVHATYVDDGWTALFHAVWGGRNEMVQVLISEFRLDIYHRANKGTLAVHTAAYNDRAECIAILLDAGLDINITGRLGRTALHWAVKQGAVNAVKLLLERGADITVEDEERSITPLNMAKATVLALSERSHGPEKDGKFRHIYTMLKDHKRKLDSAVSKAKRRADSDGPNSGPDTKKISRD